MTWAPGGHQRGMQLLHGGWIQGPPAGSQHPPCSAGIVLPIAADSDERRGAGRPWSPVCQETLRVLLHTHTHTDRQTD